MTLSATTAVWHVTTVLMEGNVISGKVAATVPTDGSALSATRVRIVPTFTDTNTHTCILSLLYQSQSWQIYSDSCFFILTACPEGHFGKNCSFPCKCKNGASCDPVTGSCRCPPGVSGDLCQDGELSPILSQTKVFAPQSSVKTFLSTTGGSYHKFTMSCFLCAGCPKGFYGKQCNKKCNCANNGRCHRTYGACLCDPGLYGRFCHLRKSHCPHITTLTCQEIMKALIDKLTVILLVYIQYVIFNFYVGLQKQ